MLSHKIMIPIESIQIAEFFAIMHGMFQDGGAGEKRWLKDTLIFYCRHHKNVLSSGSIECAACRILNSIAFHIQVENGRLHFSHLDLCYIHEHFHHFNDILLVEIAHLTVTLATWLRVVFFCVTFVCRTN